MPCNHIQSEMGNEKISIVEQNRRQERLHNTCREVGPCPDRGQADPLALEHCRRTSCISPNPPVLTKRL